ncbi:hypothetical protein BHM03_00019990, partial [Ensete ventricosum]
IHLLEKEGATKVIATNEDEKTKIREVKSESEGELDHHIIGAVGGGTGEDEVRGGGDKYVQEEEEGLRDHCVSSIRLVDAYPPEIRPEALELVVSVGKVACVRRLTKQYLFGATTGGRFYDDSSFNH